MNAMGKFGKVMAAMGGGWAAAVCGLLAALPALAGRASAPSSAGRTRSAGTR